MIQILKRLKNKVFKKYNLSPSQMEDTIYHTWDYEIDEVDKPFCTTQKGRNKLLFNFIVSCMERYGLYIAITSNEISSIITVSDELHLISEDNLNNFKRLKVDFEMDFNPKYLMVRNDINIGIVINSNDRLSPNHIILTDSNCNCICIIDILGLPTNNLLDYFKKGGEKRD